MIDGIDWLPGAWAGRRLWLAGGPLDARTLFDWPERCPTCGEWYPTIIVEGRAGCVNCDVGESAPESAERPAIPIVSGEAIDDTT